MTSIPTNVCAKKLLSFQANECAIKLPGMLFLNPCPLFGNLFQIYHPFDEAHRERSGSWNIHQASGRRAWAPWQRRNLRNACSAFLVYARSFGSWSRRHRRFEHRCWHQVYVGPLGKIVSYLKTFLYSYIVLSNLLPAHQHPECGSQTASSTGLICSN